MFTVSALIPTAFEASLHLCPTLFWGSLQWQAPSVIVSAPLQSHADLEGAGVGSRNNIQHRIAELIPAGGQLMAQLVCHPVLLEVLHRYLGSKCRLATFSSNTLLPQGLLALLHLYYAATQPGWMSSLMPAVITSAKVHAHSVASASQCWTSLVMPSWA